MRHKNCPFTNFSTGYQSVYLNDMAATSHEVGYFYLLLHRALSYTPMSCGQLVHIYNTDQGIIYYAMVYFGPVGSSAFAGGGGVLDGTDSSPMTTASKDSC